jgi:predicted enzyme related to lactoylglutathione lyase
MASPVVHFQICAEDVDTMTAFYRDLFGWRISARRLTSVEADVSGSYPYIDAEEGGITGGITKGITGKRGNVLVVEVDGAEATLRRVEELGGRRRFPEMPPEDMSLKGSDGAERTFALSEFEDPEGNVVEIIQL